MLEAILTALIQSFKDWDWRPLAYERSLFGIYKIACQKISAPKIFESDSHGAHSEPQGLGLAPLRHTKWIYLEITKSSAEFSRTETFWKRLPRRAFRALRIGIGAPLAHERNLFGNSKSAYKIFRAEKLMKAIPTARTQSLKDWDWRPSACERSLFGTYKIECKKFPRRKLLKAIPTALSQSLKDWDWRPFGIRKEFI